AATSEIFSLSLHDALPISLAFFARTGGKTLYGVFQQAATEAAAICLLIGTAAPFAFLLATDGVAGHVMDFVAMLGGSAFAVLLRSEEHTSELQSRENLVCR